MNPFDISLELSGLSLFQQPSFRTTILRQVVPDNNFEKSKLLLWTTLLQPFVTDKLFTNHVNRYHGHFLQRKMF